MFPAIRPTQRSLVVGGLPIAMNDWNGLIHNPRPWGNQPIRAELSLTFRHIPEDDAAAFIAHYNSTLSGLLPDALAPANLSGITEPRLLARMACAWNYTQAPQIDSVITGIVNLTISLTADFSSSIVALAPAPPPAATLVTEDETPIISEAGIPLVSETSP